MAKIVPISVSEDYYQISEAVLSSFPKYRLPLDLFVLDEKTVQLLPYYKKDNRLSNEQVEEIQKMCQEGLLFVSRSDHPIYSQHIVKQLDLVLLDANLKEAEVADIIIMALDLKLTAFFAQPVKILFQPLLDDCNVFTEYLWEDKHRIKLFLRRLYQGEHKLTLHSINTLIVGLWLFINAKAEELLRKELDSLTLGLLLHDVGMGKVPPVVLNKEAPLKQDERSKITAHVLTGMQILQKMDLVSPEIKAACLEHHERGDGSGYPQKLKSPQISMIGSIAAVADSFSAMIQKRPYAEAKTQLDAGNELMNDSARYDRRFGAALYTALVTNSF
jgi:HD-GYP domain-containing protein (c-di-GMP phosphodiesterase class II)